MTGCNLFCGSMSATTSATCFVGVCVCVVLMRFLLICCWVGDLICPHIFSVIYPLQSTERLQSKRERIVI